MRKNHHCTLVWTICFHEIAGAHGTLTLFAFTLAFIWHTLLPIGSNVFRSDKRPTLEIPVLYSCYDDNLLLVNAFDTKFLWFTSPPTQHHGITGSRAGTVVRALTSHRCGKGSILSTDHMWAKFVVGSFLCSERFSPSTPVFPSPQKPALLKIPMRFGMLERITHEPLARETG